MANSTLFTGAQVTSNQQAHKPQVPRSEWWYQHQLVNALAHRDPQLLRLTALVLAGSQVDGGNTAMERDDRRAAQRGTAAHARCWGRDNCVPAHTARSSRQSRWAQPGDTAKRALATGPPVGSATLGSLGQLRAKSVYFLIQNVPVMPPRAEGSGRTSPGAAPAVPRERARLGGVSRVCGGSGGADPRYRQRDPPEHGHNGRPRTRLRFLRLFRGSGGSLGVTGWPGGSAAAPSPPGGAPGAGPPPPPPASIAAAPGAAPLPWRPAAPNTRGGGAIAAPSSHRP